ncbi:hypothetical protein BQ8420_14775 [Nocardiopsis sp. JB363]|nr:hypothetical protein BQ8420_14775 [Nocardiopsis sp. JB363]
MCPDPWRHDARSYYREVSMALTKSLRERLRDDCAVDLETGCAV